MVDVEDNAAPVVTPTPRSVLDETLTATDVEPPRGGGPSGPTHTLRNVIIGTAISGAVVGVVIGTTGSGSSRQCVRVAPSAPCQ
jgi:hypothetical protein